MANQTSVEATNAATYVENYLDCVENLPDELQRLISRMRELDVCFLAKVKEAHYWKKQADGNPNHKRRFFQRMEQALRTGQEIGDEKMAIVQAINDKIELRYKLLDIDFKNLDIAKEEPAPTENKDVVTPSAAASTSNPTTASERPIKRARRGGRTENVSISENNHNDSTITELSARNSTPSTSNTSQRKTAGKKKKRKSRQNTQVQREDNSPREEVEEPIIDPDEPTYCLCDQISYGEMIMCDNDLCPIEWFHFSCVSLTTKPKGKWYCPKCRGDRPNVMKPKAQFLRELEKYNKEKEDKT